MEIIFWGRGDVAMEVMELWSYGVMELWSYGVMGEGREEEWEGRSTHFRIQIAEVCIRLVVLRRCLGQFPHFHKSAFQFLLHQ